jgi:O-antigen ligase
MVVAVLGIILFMHYQSKWRRLFYGTVILTSIVSMIYTFTRSTYVGLAVSLFIIGFFRYRKILAVLAVLFLLVVVNPIFSMRFGVLLGGESGDLSMELRMSLWSRMRDYILSSPVLGHGIGSFAPSSEKYAGFYMTSHSGFIKIFSEVGLLGLLLYFWVLLDLLKKCYLVYTKDESPFYRNMALVCFTLLVSNILINLVQNTFSMPVYQLAIWALFGIIYSTSSARQHKP